MNMHGSVNNLLTLLLLEQSPKTVDLLLDEGNEGTVGRMLGSPPFAVAKFKGVFLL